MRGPVMLGDKWEAKIWLFKGHFSNFS